MTCNSIPGAMYVSRELCSPLTKSVYIRKINKYFFLDKGVDKVEISLEKQQVLVTSSISAESLTETLKKTGKAVTYISSS
jgi:hypothetical protein